MKPNDWCQGKGIIVSDDINEITAKHDSTRVVSHYIDDPYLIEGYKFDLRIYVAITSMHPLRVYMYDEGFVRFATKKYSSEASTKGDV